jgi:hypothetical protein
MYLWGSAGCVECAVVEIAIGRPLVPARKFDGISKPTWFHFGNLLEVHKSESRRKPPQCQGISGPILPTLGNTQNNSGIDTAHPWL